MVAKVIRSDNEGSQKVQIAIPKVSKAVDEIIAQEYDIVEHNLGRITDDMECEEIQEGMVSIRERLRKANERIVKLEAENKSWRECQPIQQLHQAALPQDSKSNIEEISAQLREVKDWTSVIIQDGRNFLPSFISTFRSLLAIRKKFKTFEGEWKDFLPVKDLAIPRLWTFIGLPERYLETIKLVDEGGMGTVESWYVALTIRLRILEEIRNEIAQHSPGVDTCISIMLGDVGVALDFEGIKEKDVNEIEFGSRLDELGKFDIEEKYLGTLASLNAFSGYANEYEKDHEKTMQAVSNMMNSAKLKMKYTPCPPVKDVNDRLSQVH